MRQLNPFSGMQVSLQDATFWTVETANSVKLRINSDLYNQGIVNGLTLFSSGTQSGTAAYTQGVAYDSNGERIAVPALQDTITYKGSPLNTGQTYSVALRYVLGNDGTMGLDVNGACNFRHLIDSFSTVVAQSGVDTLLSSDVVLGKVFSTSNGSTLIFTSGAAQTFSAKYQAPVFPAIGPTNITTVTLNATSISVTSIYAANVYSPNLVTTFSGPITGLSNIVAQGDFYATTAGLGLIVLSPDGTKQARIMLNNTGFLALQPLNYSIT